MNQLSQYSTVSAEGGGYQTHRVDCPSPPTTYLSHYPHRYIVTAQIRQVMQYTNPVTMVDSKKPMLYILTAAGPIESGDRTDATPGVATIHATKARELKP
jgi:hypothetical protein